MADSSNYKGIAVKSGGDTAQPGKALTVLSSGDPAVMGLVLIPAGECPGALTAAQARLDSRHRL